MSTIRVSHTKASLVGSSISIPITDGHLNLGTWQGHKRKKFFDRTRTYTFPLGIYLTEFRHLAHTRRVVATVLWVVHSVEALSNFINVIDLNFPLKLILINSLFLVLVF